MQDINTGRGWKLGQKINQLEYEFAIDSKKQEEDRGLSTEKYFGSSIRYAILEQ
jgi:hypothetical protein